MNLIEQLGGYEKAKQILISCEFHGRKDLRVPVAGGFIHIVVDFLEKDLLDYRREHNIFEVGDFIVLLHTNYRSDVFALTKSFKEIYDEKGIVYRHATDAEIQAGHRL